MDQGPHLGWAVLRQATQQLAVGPHRQGRFDRIRLHPSAVLQHQRSLAPEEGKLQIDLMGVQTGDHLGVQGSGFLPHQPPGHGDQIAGLLWSHTPIKPLMTGALQASGRLAPWFASLPIHRHKRAAAAEAQAAHRLRVHRTRPPSRWLCRPSRTRESVHERTPESFTTLQPAATGGAAPQLNAGGGGGLAGAGHGYHGVIPPAFIGTPRRCSSDRTASRSCTGNRPTSTPSSSSNGA